MSGYRKHPSVELRADGDGAIALHVDSGEYFELNHSARFVWIALDELDRMWLPVIRHWRLNERHYGALQGLNKAETAEKHGEDQVKIWRRSYDTPPPPLEDGDERSARNDRRYAALGDEEPFYVSTLAVPTGEQVEGLRAHIMQATVREGFI